MSDRGAEFRKADLQIHSPRDAGWIGARPDEGLDAADSVAIAARRDEWSEDFLNKCVAEGLSAIAITDHHEGTYVYNVIEVARKIHPDRIWVFPGMELTCKDSCQALLLFDANLTQPLFEKARGKLGLPTETFSARQVGIAVDLLASNLEQLQELLESDDELRGRFIILPHVKPGGHKTVLRTGFHRRFRDMPYVGGYMDATYPDQLNAGDRRILDGEIPAWTSERRGVICTSDARHADFRLLGSHATWIKLAVPTAESLRQAMLAPDSRLLYSEPVLPRVVVRELRVAGCRHIADGVYYFNSQLNVIIGGRGAGKSSVLELLLFGLGNSALDSSSENVAAKRMGKMLADTLDPVVGVVEVLLLLNGAEVILRREMATLSGISLTTGGSTKRTTPSDIHNLIPVQAFRQGELSDLGVEEADTKLIQLITADSREELLGSTSPRFQ
jgi:type III restriction enzyme